MLPTLAAVVGEELPAGLKLDGTNILPLFENEPFHREKPLYWFFYRTSPEMAMRIGPYAVMGKDRDSLKHSHALTAPDMPYLKQLRFDEFEAYDLRSDLGQQHDLFDSLENGSTYASQLRRQMEEIQSVGPFWENLPSADKWARLKTEWVEE
jgi:arylsulfatase A